MNLVVFTVIDIVALVAVLAIYLYVVGKQLTKVAGNLEDAADLVWKIKKNDMNATTPEAGIKVIAGTARNMGIEVVD